ncbi:FadR family transcriptional regulator [Alkalihalobacillus oceani]|uniref:FadR/GntR family transcriptional regulator n=1 Tax=Halalkalibacter oceani TaxID=1653776 RepID=UPI00203FC57C|nr:FadR/GntR family transcriptional regulator [Halalkalibacter oceani]MCM3760258.1 FadR family transcriptional regulator [Halalkalibacter oceani]
MDIISPIQRRKMSEQILDEIKALIKDGTFPADSKLPSETELAKLFQVSRSPVREAISVLAASGIVESRQGGGNWVRKVELVNMLEPMTMEMIDAQQIFDLLELRTTIETEAAALAAVRHSKEDIEKLAEALQGLEKQMLDDVEAVGSEVDYEFHQMIVGMAGNPFFVQTMENIADLYQRAMAFSLKQNVGLRVKRKSVFEEHQAIFEAIRRREPEAASQAMKQHLETARIKLGDKRLQDQEKRGKQA